MVRVAMGRCAGGLVVRVKDADRRERKKTARVKEKEEGGSRAPYKQFFSWQTSTLIPKFS